MRRACAGTQALQTHNHGGDRFCESDPSLQPLVELCQNQLGAAAGNGGAKLGYSNLLYRFFRACLDAVLDYFEVEIERNHRFIDKFGSWQHRKYSGRKFKWLRAEWAHLWVPFSKLNRVCPQSVKTVAWVSLLAVLAVEAAADVCSSAALASKIRWDRILRKRHKLERTVDSIDDTEIVGRIEAKRFNGRHGYPPRAMWRAYIASYVLGLPSTNALIRELQEDPGLRRICGLRKRLPHRTTFNRFFDRLADHQELVDKCLADLVVLFRELLPRFGEKVAIDSTTVRTHAHPTRKSKMTGRTSDPEASWTAKPSDRSQDGKEWSWGYKLHMMADAVHGIPLYCYTTTASRGDTKELPIILDRARKALTWLKPTRVMADRGYDSLANHEAVKKRGGILIAPVRRSTSNALGLHEGVYTSEGVPTCLGVVPMVYERSERTRGRLYKCRPEGCDLLLVKGRRYCNQEYWVNRKANLRLFSPIRRDSVQWKNLYALRQSVERVFKSLKESLRLERHCFRGLRKVSLHAAMSVLAFTATRLVNLLAQELNPTWMVRKVA